MFGMFLMCHLEYYMSLKIMRKCFRVKAHAIKAGQRVCRKFMKKTKAGVVYERGMKCHMRKAGMRKEHTRCRGKAQ